MSNFTFTEVTSNSYIDTSSNQYHNVNINDVPIIETNTRYIVDDDGDSDIWGVDADDNYIISNNVIEWLVDNNISYEICRASINIPRCIVSDGRSKDLYDMNIRWIGLGLQNEEDVMLFKLRWV